MNKLLLSLLFVLLFHGIRAQTTDSVAVNDLKGEQLAQLAWTNSTLNQVYDTDNQVANSDIRTAKYSWFDGLSLGLNVNEFTINPQDQQSAFYPRYNFGFSFNFGQVFGTAGEIKKAKAQLIKLNFKRSDDSLRLRSEVLRRYESYKMTQELMIKAQENLIDVSAELAVIEKQYADGESDLTTYRELLDIHTNSLYNEIKASSGFNTAKINLEEIIGVKLEEALINLE